MLYHVTLKICNLKVIVYGKFFLFYLQNLRATPQTFLPPKIPNMASCLKNRDFSPAAAIENHNMIVTYHKEGFFE